MNCAACIWKAMVMPRSSVIKLESVFCAVSERVLSAPHSRIKLPNISMPTSERDAGAIKPEIMVTSTGKRILVSLLTCEARYFILMRRSFFVVHIFTTAG